MKVYVAASREDIGTASGLATMLIDDGHEVVSTWHYSPIPDTDSGIPASDAITQAEGCLKEVNQATLLILIRPAGGRGCWVEWGYAHALGIETWLVAREREPVSIFEALANRTFGSAYAVVAAASSNPEETRWARRVRLVDARARLAAAVLEGEHDALLG